jgi:PAS domain S-box-containing protein
MLSPETDEAAALVEALLHASDDAILSTDLDGVITSWTVSAERVYGMPAEQILGHPLSEFVAAEKRADIADILRRVAAGETVRNFDTVGQRRSGQRTSLTMIASPIHRENAVRGAMWILRDLGGRERADRAARRLAAIVESSDDAIVSKDLNGIVMSWNRAAEQMFGYTAEEMIGESIRRIIPADRQNEEDQVLEQVRRGQKVDHFETIRRRKDGSEVNISLTVSPIVSAAGVVVGASKIARDISARKTIEEERARLLALTRAAAAITERLNAVGSVVASELDRGRIVQAVTDEATAGIGADFGAFFYNVTDPESGDAYLLYTLSGADKEAFRDFPHPRATALFAPTFNGEGVVRIADVVRDDRYGKNAPYYGTPPGHLPVRSYLAVPVKARSGDVLGGLFFAHAQPGRFTADHERFVVGVATWASIALENARLYVGVQEASQLKDEFLATLSHELRTPLNAILGYARMVRSGIVTADRVARAVEVIERNATSLTQIVEDVLDVSRIVSGKMRLNVQPVDLPEIVRNAVDGVVPAADAKGVQIEVALDPPAAPVSGDPERLQQVIWNLMSNAVKFTPRGGRVQVRLQRVDAHVEIVVADTGIGISKEFLPFIFDRFRQADAGMTREHGGLGLGLGIARQLVEMHGGTIHATSGGSGQGATFRVALPLMIVHPERPADRRPPPPASAAPGTLQIPDLHEVRILAVDDDLDALAMVREILETTGAQVSVAHSAGEALDALQIVKPHVLVADLGMPQMDGFELIARVRRNADRAVRDVPAAALTAYARSEDRAKALRSGFQLHLSKPIDPAELMAAIAALARRAVPSNGS